MNDARVLRLLEMCLEGLRLAEAHTPANVQDRLTDYIVHTEGAIEDLRESDAVVCEAEMENR
jgi:hypothetical protein